MLRRRISDMEWTEGECRRLKDTLRKSEDAFRKLVHQSNDAILIMDSVSHHVVDANPRACALLGYSRQQLISTSASAVYPDHFPQFQVFARSVSEAGHGSTDQITCSTKSGQVVAVELSAYMIDVAGRPCMVSMLRDLIELNRLQAQHHQARVRESFGRSTREIAHDIGNMLTPIMSYVELANREVSPDGNLRFYLLEGRKAAGRAANLTHQLLTLCRGQTSDKRVLDIDELILNMDGKLRRFIGSDVLLVTLPAGGLGLARVDPGQLEQVLIDLAVNARGTIPNGGRLVIETANVTVDDHRTDQPPGPPPGTHVLISVGGCGSAMKGEVKERLFVPSFIAEEEGDCASLGLSRSYDIVTHHGGHMAVESEPGQGATFKVYLPTVAEEPGVYDALG